MTLQAAMTERFLVTLSRNDNEVTFSVSLLLVPSCLPKHFLWVYPPNGTLLGQAFGVCLRYVQGEYLWRWIIWIAEMKQLYMVWPANEYNNPDGRIILVSVDGVDLRCWEPAHPRYNLDRGQYSH